MFRLCWCLLGVKFAAGVWWGWVSECSISDSHGNPLRIYSQGALSWKCLTLTTWVVATQVFFLCSPRKLGKIPSLTSIFVKGIETTNQQLIGEAEEQHCVPFVGWWTLGIADWKRPWNPWSSDMGCWELVSKRSWGDFWGSTSSEIRSYGVNKSDEHKNHEDILWWLMVQKVRWTNFRLTVANIVITIPVLSGIKLTKLTSLTGNLSCTPSVNCNFWYGFFKWILLGPTVLGDSDETMGCWYHISVKLQPLRRKGPAFQSSFRFCSSPTNWIALMVEWLKIFQWTRSLGKSL